jgi:hypothetical protein
MKGEGERRRSLKASWNRGNTHQRIAEEAMKKIRASWLPLLGSTRDVGLVLYGQAQRTMEHDDRRLQICAGVQVLTILKGHGRICCLTCHC